MKQSFLFFLGLSFLFLPSCKEKPHEKIIRPVKTMKVSSSMFSGKIFPGYAEAEEYSYLTFRVSGMLLHFDIQEGQNLKAGELVGSLDPHDYNLKLSSAKASFRQAQSQMERYKRLYDKSAISKQEYEIAAAAYENSKSVYNQALNDMSYTRLVAPFAGNVEKKYVENHQQVMAGEKIIKLNNPQKIQFRFILPETNAKFADNDFKCSVELDVQKGVFYKAKVKEIITSSVGGSGIPVIIKIDDPAYNPKKVKVMPGYTCNVRIDSKDTTQNTQLIIPLICIYTDPGNNKNYVWKVDESNAVVHKVPVETGDLSGEKDIVILSGLKEGDRIATAGFTMLSDGEHVKIIEP